MKCRRGILTIFLLKKKSGTRSFLPQPSSVTADNWLLIYLAETYIYMFIYIYTYKIESRVLVIREGESVTDAAQRKWVCMFLYALSLFDLTDLLSKFLHTTRKWIGLAFQ